MDKKSLPSHRNENCIKRVSNAMTLQHLKRGRTHNRDCGDDNYIQQILIGWNCSKTIRMLNTISAKKPVCYYD
ncbi:MAG: hypothetical protein PWQ88_402 [Candidatus Methanomethylophilaceae archaeon]|nr:hypothetical protein [Candidatus Methanomethylophilaceae archaeon]MDI3541131.1 hypothetical protein [Candidatus Methanomethylophilaceae archaeon]